MKRILTLFLMLWTGVLFATTNHSLTFDGTNEFTADETFSTSTDGYSAYCTWDADYLYLGAVTDYLSSVNDTIRGHYTHFWYIDTNANRDPKTGPGSDKAGTVWTQIMPQQPWYFDEQSWTLPFNADFMVKSQYTKSDSIYVSWGNWDENSQLWTKNKQDTNQANLNLNAAYYELKVPWDTLGNVSKIYILGYICSTEWMGDLYYDPDPQRDVGGTMGSWPANSLKGGDGDKGSNGKFLHWFSFEINTGISPDQANDPPYVSDIPDQTITQGESFTTIDLNKYVLDDLSGDTAISWTYNGNTELTVSIDGSNTATVSTPNNDWTGSEIITFIAQDEQGAKDSSAAVFSASVPSAVNTENGSVPTGFVVSQNYPNPFNPTTTIEYGLAQRGSVQITISDINGRQVFHLSEPEKDAGFHSINIDASHLPSGIYIYRISSAGHSQTKKMMLVK